MNKLNDADDKIDLLDLFEMILRNKWKMVGITLITSLVITSYGFFKTNSYDVTTIIIEADDSSFIKYMPLNEILIENNYLQSFQITSENIFNLFITEFKDYDELIIALSKNNFVQQSTKDLDKVNKRKKLIDYAKLFTLKPLSDSNDQNNSNDQNVEYEINFKWHNINEGLAIIKDTLNLVSSNVKDSVLETIKNSADTLQALNKKRIESLQMELDQLEKKQVDYFKHKILYLREQSLIAKSLDLETNKLDNNSLIQTDANEIISLNISGEDAPYYLRGYKAIDEEIFILESRTKEMQLLFTPGYFEINDELTSLSSNSHSVQVRSYLDLIKTDNHNYWIKSDFEFYEVKSQMKLTNYFFLSIILGILLSTAYVFINNSIVSRKNK